jgi:hypothetical protein
LGNLPGKLALLGRALAAAGEHPLPAAPAGSAAVVVVLQTVLMARAALSAVEAVLGKPALLHLQAAALAAETLPALGTYPAAQQPYGFTIKETIS